MTLVPKNEATNVVLEGTALVSKHGRGEGSWRSQSAFLNDKKIHDNNEYQDFSLELETKVPFAKYREIADMWINPSGYKVTPVTSMASDQGNRVYSPVGKRIAGVAPKDTGFLVNGDQTINSTNLTITIDGAGSNIPDGSLIAIGTNRFIVDGAVSAGATEITVDAPASDVEIADDVNVQRLTDVLVVGESTTINLDVLNHGIKAGDDILIREETKEERLVVMGVNGATLTLENAVDETYDAYADLFLIES